MVQGGAICGETGRSVRFQESRQCGWFRHRWWHCLVLEFSGFVKFENIVAGESTVVMMFGHAHWLVLLQVDHEAPEWEFINSVLIAQHSERECT